MPLTPNSQRSSHSIYGRRQAHNVRSASTGDCGEAAPESQESCRADGEECDGAAPADASLAVPRRDGVSPPRSGASTPSVSQELSELRRCDITTRWRRSFAAPLTKADWSYLVVARRCIFEEFVKIATEGALGSGRRSATRERWRGGLLDFLRAVECVTLSPQRHRLTMTQE